MDKTEKLTNTEVIAQLRQMVKPYIGVMSQAQFSGMLIRIENELCKPKTVANFFAKWGYYGTWDNYKKPMGK